MMKLRFRPWTLPLALLAAGLLAFGVLMPRLGFYWDDWSPVLVNRVYGADAFWRFYAFDRPSSAWTYVLLAPLFDGHALAWQVFTALMRWLTAVGMAWTFALVWPRARRLVAAAALLFLVYPVFTQQSISVTYHQLWVEFALFFASLGAMLQAVKCRARPLPFWGWTLAALAAFGANFSISEYFIGVELLRPLLIWWVLQADLPALRRRLARTLLLWLPYLLALLLFVYWRLFLVKIVGADPNQVTFLAEIFAHPGSALFNLAQLVARDGLQILISSWYATLNPGLIDLGRGFSLFTWFLVGMAALFFAFYLYRLEEAEQPVAADPKPDMRLGIPGQMALTGLLAILLGPLPAWITGRSLAVAPDAFSDRYAAAAMFGAALVWVAALEWLTPRRLQKVILTGALIGLAVGLHVRTANEYRWYWTQQARFFWQLSWRAPSIEPATALLSPDDIFPRQGRFATSVALNLAYPNTYQPEFLNYWIFSLDPGFRGTAGQLAQGLKLDDDFRIFKFKGSSRDSLVIQYKPESGTCLWVLQPGESYAPGLSDTTREALPAANLARIQAEPAEGYPPPEIFGPEPEHGWCYLYQKAGLALQQQDWTDLEELETRAREQGYGPGRSGSDTPFEWLVFLEGHARAGRWQQAVDLNAEISATKRVSTVDGMLCAFWQRMQAELPASAEKNAALQQVNSALGCGR